MTRDDDEDLREPPARYELSEDAKVLWRRLAPTLIARGHLDALSSTVFWGLVSRVANYLKFHRQVELLRRENPHADFSELQASVVESRNLAANTRRSSSCYRLSARGWHL